MDSINELLTQTRSAGAVVYESIQFLDSVESGVGIFARAAVPKQSILISVPYKICLTVDLVSSSSQLGCIFANKPGFLQYPDEVLAIGLMFASSNPSSTECAWHGHVKTMPSTFNTTIYWSEEELTEMKGCNVFHLTKMMK